VAAVAAILFTLIILLSHGCVADGGVAAHGAVAFLAKRGMHPRIQCTMHAAGLLIGVRRRSLAEACSVYLGVDASKAHQTSDWVAPTLCRSQLTYAAGEAVLTRRLWGKTLDSQTACR
jgi:3'-5' exonuclease